MLRILLATLLVAFLPLAPVAGQSSASAGVTYYLHQTGACENDGSETFTDQTDSKDDLDGCGTIGAGGSAGGFALEFPGRATLGTVSLDAASTAKAIIYIATETPARISVEVGVSAAGASCSGVAAEQTVPNTPLTYEFTPFEVSCKVTGSAAATVTPSVSLVIHSETHYFLGYEGDHTSRVEIQGTSVITNSTTPPPSLEPEEDTPAPAALMALSILAVVAAIVLRRRE